MRNMFHWVPTFYSMECYCLKCGKSITRLPQNDKHKEIIDILDWQWTALDFGDKSKLRLCYKCSYDVTDKHRKDYSYRNSGKDPKFRVSICQWDLENDRPFFSPNGLPMKYEVSSGQRLNGQNRGINEERAIEEVSIPVFNQIPVSDENSFVITEPPSANRRSNRKKPEEIEAKLHSQIQQKSFKGLKIIKNKLGRGVATTKSFVKDEFVCTYYGDIITREESYLRETEYAKKGKGCYQYDFIIEGKHITIDATRDDPSFGIGRLINHDSKKPNLKTKKIVIQGIPYLYFLASRDIQRGESLFYDYNDPKSGLPWM